MRHCDGGVGRWVGAAEIQLCRCKINDLIKEETSASIFFYPPGPLGSPDPYALLNPIWLSHPLGLSPSTLLCLHLRFPKIAGCLKPSSASDIASDTHPLLSYNLIVECWPPASPTVRVLNHSPGKDQTLLSATNNHSLLVFPCERKKSYH